MKFSLCNFAFGNSGFCVFALKIKTLLSFVLFLAIICPIRKPISSIAELFDLSLLEGEIIREWLFFDKPRRAFESGNRKQRSLPDYSGRGWHESRKQVMKEFAGQKRSYYMDPQPSGKYEWHLFEYEIYGCDAFALYRLELKLANQKKSPKAKVPKDSLADLQKKMGRLTAEVPGDDKPPGKGKTKANKKAATAAAAAANVNSAQD